MKRALPKGGERWMHFKGGVYSITGISHPVDKLPMPIFVAIDANTNALINYSIVNGQCVHLKTDSPNTIVVYQRWQSRKTWSRDLSDFMSEDNRSSNGLKFWKADTSTPSVIDRSAEIAV